MWIRIQVRVKLLMNLNLNTAFFLDFQYKFHKCCYNLDKLKNKKKHFIINTGM